MLGKLFVIGIGPGDPELMTLKAVRILKETPCIFVPKGREEGTSLALSIVQKALELDGKEIVEAYFPMKLTRAFKSASPSPALSPPQPITTPLTPAPLPQWEREKGRGGLSLEGLRQGGDANELDAKWNEAVEAVLNKLDRGIDAAFITIGDPAIYSTFFYLHERLLERRPALTVEIVPGISSINASAARAGMYLGLGNERIAILPANYLDSLQDTLEKFDTVVLMKVNKVFDTVKETLVRMDLAAKAVYVCRAGMEDERVHKDIRQVREEDLNYFSLVIVRKR